MEKLKYFSVALKYFSLKNLRRGKGLNYRNRNLKICQNQILSLNSKKIKKNGSHLPDAAVH